MPDRMTSHQIQNFSIFAKVRVERFGLTATETVTIFSQGLRFR